MSRVKVIVLALSCEAACVRSLAAHVTAPLDAADLSTAFQPDLPLTREEVLRVRQEVTWRRIRFFMVLIFWGIMAMFLSIVACILITTPSCNSFDVGLGSMPAVPPVHMSLAPLISTGRSLTEDPSYTL